MSIYLGESGYIELQRREMNNALSTTLDIADVNAERRRFGTLDFDSYNLITGDKVEIKRTDGGATDYLQLVAGITDQRGFARYVHVDDAGGIRLYDNFNAAVNGEFGNALPLVTPTVEQQITMAVVENRWRCLGQVREYSFTTSRETVDLTSIGEEFRRNYASGLISGQGSCTAIWDYKTNIGEEDVEFVNYVAQLCLRINIGAAFNGRFYIKREGVTSQDACAGSESEEGVWWEADCIVTNVSMSFSPGTVIDTQIQFVTTGDFRLRIGQAPRYMLQEDGELTLNDNGEPVIYDADDGV